MAKVLGGDGICDKDGWKVLLIDVECDDLGDTGTGTVGKDLCCDRICAKDSWKLLIGGCCDDIGDTGICDVTIGDTGTGTVGDDLGGDKICAKDNWKLLICAGCDPIGDTGICDVAIATDCDDLVGGLRDTRAEPGSNAELRVIKSGVS